MQLPQTVAEWAFYKNPPDPAAYYRRLKEIGFIGIELAPPERFDLIRAAGLKLININGTPNHGGLNRVEDHADSLPQIREALAIARANQIPFIIVFAGLRRGQPDELGIKNCVTALKSLAREAEQAGITFIFEPFNTFDHPDYQADSSHYAFQVARGVSSPAVKVLYDIYHMHRMGEDVTLVILQNLPLIGHFHIAGSPRRDFPGPDQAIDYPSLIRQVLAAGYKGYWGHEYLPGADPLDDLTKSFALFSSLPVERP